jgi:hypothetical protein
VKKKSLLILIDNTAVTKTIAENIASVIGSAKLENWKAKIVNAESFSPTQLLPAHAFLLGCEKPEPPDFTGVKELFKHINLAGRPCGVFSSKTTTIKYLSTLVRDSEALIGSPFVAKNGVAGKQELRKWLKGVLDHKA